MEKNYNKKYRFLLNGKVLQWGEGKMPEIMLIGRDLAKKHSEPITCQLFNKHRFEWEKHMEFANSGKVHDVTGRAFRVSDKGQTYTIKH